MNTKKRLSHIVFFFEFCDLVNKQLKLHSFYSFTWASQMVLVVKNPPANAGDIRDMGLTQGWEDSLEEDMVTHSSILAWRISWTEEPGRLQSTGLQRVRHD